MSSPMQLNNLIDILACPDCQRRVKYAENETHLQCIHCGQTFCISHGIPIMFSVETKTQFEETIKSNPRPGSVQHRVSFMSRLIGIIAFILSPPSPSLNLSMRRISALMKENLLVTDPIALNIGGLRDSDKKHFDFDIVNLDFSYDRRISVAGDGQKLPFLNESFDAVIVQAVLEHVLYPEQVVTEIRRVLKNDGIVYASVPFIQSYHWGPRDFRRYTLEGLNELFSSFQRIESAPGAGPASGLAWILRDFIVNFSDTPAIRTVLRYFAGWMVFPVKYFDYLLVRKKSAYISAAAFYLIARKKE